MTSYYNQLVPEREKKIFHLLGRHVEGRTRLQLLHVFLLPGISWRSHLGPLFLISLYPVPFPLLFPPHPLLLPLALPLPLPLPPLPLPVIPLPLSVPVAFSRVPLTLALLGDERFQLFSWLNIVECLQLIHEWGPLPFLLQSYHPCPLPEQHYFIWVNLTLFCTLLHVGFWVVYNLSSSWFLLWTVRGVMTSLLSRNIQCAFTPVLLK